MNAEEILISNIKHLESFKHIDTFESRPEYVLKAMEEYANQVKPKWIPVEERLPDKFELVLTFGHPNDGGMYMCLCEHSDGIFRHHITDKENKHAITHWMSLPEAPVIEQK